MANGGETNVPKQSIPCRTVKDLPLVHSSSGSSLTGGLFGLLALGRSQLLTPIAMTNRKRIAILKHIIADKPNSLSAEIAMASLQYSRTDSRIEEHGTGDVPEAYFHDLDRHGCKGVASVHLNMAAFFDRHYDEIETARCEYESEYGWVQVGNDIKCDYAWFAYNRAAEKLARKLGLRD